MLLCAFVASLSAEAENQAKIDALKIEVDYDACTIERTQKTEFCANEKWNIDVNPDGWSATGTGTDGAPPVLEMSATCQNGGYKLVTNGQLWRAKCELTGDAVHPCFHVMGGGSNEAFSKLDSLQCFDIAENACSIKLEGMVIAQGPAIKGEYDIALTGIKTCRIVD